ncbi:MAG: hypothetical protein F4091_00895 [Acidimicrobiales bacterium]|nr:hypothetical protein [Acidimicrobiales bacterium]MYD83191.1 hypothetical protein [Acidimicrobiales bacterium]MYJ64014.1 hypothetical protein [Acidimicrobiales bacterium]
MCIYDMQYSALTNICRLGQEVVPVSRVAVKEGLRLGHLHYRDETHRELPHILSFSGGRSSAALAFMAAGEGLLRPERGDLLLFANTSAEHPGTYDFAAECKSRIEREFGLPFLWLEFCTVEDAWRGEYWRRDSYRLVKPVPIEEDPEGYRSRGEAFEELLSYQGMLPNPHSRTCTAKLKLYPSHKLLADWLGGTQGPAHAGHHWPAEDHEFGANLVCAEQFADGYVRRGGSAPREQALLRAEHLASLPSQRQAQRFADFTGAPLCKNLNGHSESRMAEPRPAPMRGPEAAGHVRLLGLRADEPRRVDRVLLRCLFAEGATTAGCTVKTQPPGERPYFPLYEAGVDADAVADYWRGRDFDLDIPPGAGNCTFCFMKGTRQLIELSAAPDHRRNSGTPSEIGWWADVEQRHMRTEPSRHGDGISTFGFFGVNAGTFDDLAHGCTGALSRYEQGTPACDCTD